jgi:hypothetical protein
MDWRFYAAGASKSSPHVLFGHSSFELGGDAGNHVVPVALAPLPEQPHRRVPELSSRSIIHGQSHLACSNVQTGTASAPARCAASESIVIASYGVIVEGATLSK